MLQTEVYLEVSRRTTFWNTPVQVIEFLAELYNVKTSIIFLKSDSAREALLAILKNRKNHRKHSRFSV